MYDSHSIPVSVEFQHKYTSFYLMWFWLGDHLDRILLNEEMYKKHCCGHHYAFALWQATHVDQIVGTPRLMKEKPTMVTEIT